MEHVFKKAILPLSILSLLLMSYVPAIAAERINIVTPQKTHFAGQPMLFHIQALDFVSPKAAAVHYRGIGVSVFRRLAMEKASPADFRAILSGQKVFPPGVEFYFVVEDESGRVFTFPAEDPKEKPFRIEIDLDQNPPQIRETRPTSKESLEERRPEIRIRFEDLETRVDRSSVRLLLNGIDVTGLSEVSEEEIVYRPDTDLLAGDHALIVELADMVGNRIKPQQIDFSIPAKAPPRIGLPLDKATAEAQWDAEVTRGIVQKKDSASPDWKVQSSLTVKAGGEKDKFKTQFDAGVWYLEEEGPGPAGDNFDLARFLLTLEYDKQKLSLGDVTVTGTELISQSIARRGGNLQLNIAQTRAQVFAVRSNSVSGFREGLGFEKPDQRLTGATLEQDVLADKKLTLGAAVVDGRNHDPAGSNAGTQQAGTEGQIYSLFFSSKVIEEKLKVEGEYAASRFDNDVGDSLDKNSDHAWRTRLSGRYDRFDWGAGYKYFGPEFSSIVNPTGVKDREEFQLDGGARFQTSSLRAAFVRSRDNVDGSPLMPVIRNSTGTLSYNISPTGWPSLFANAAQSFQESSKEPTGFNPLETATRTLGLGFSLARERWNLTPQYTLTTVDDRSDASDNDSDTHTVTISGGVRPADNVSVNPSLSYTQIDTQTTGVTTRNWQGALGGVISFMENALNVNTTLSVLDNRSDDDASHTSTYSAVAQINWRLEKYLLEKGRQTLSLRAQYSNTVNHLTDANAEDYTVYAVLSFGLPFRFE